MSQGQEQMDTVQVEKAAVPLVDGESITKFASRVGDAARAALGYQLGLGDRDWCYPTEVLAGRAVMRVHKQNAEGASYWAFGYTRDMTTGKFTFEEAVEVVKVVQYVPKSKAKPPMDTVQITKSQALWSGVV